jgi:hypothetical protein
VSQQKKQHPGIFAPPDPSPYYPLPPQPVRAPGTPDSFTVHVTVLADPGATVARGTLSTADNMYDPFLTATGSSKRDNTDIYDPETGTALALARLFLKMGHQLSRQANGQVKHAANVRAQKEKAQRDRAARKTAPGHGSNAADYRPRHGPVTHTELGLPPQPGDDS